MPGRECVFFNNGVYHVYNKSIEAKKVFQHERLSSYFMKIAHYYRSSEAKQRYSDFTRLQKERQNELFERIIDPATFKVHILAYCLMPTHYHFMVEQKQDLGLQQFISQVTNSFTRYYNKMTKRVGPLFLTQFKAVPIVSDEQLIHVSRYIHLNPYSSKLVRDIDALASYRFSSYMHYISENTTDFLTFPQKVLALFQNNKQRYKLFVLDHAQHQQMLESCKHMFR